MPSVSIPRQIAYPIREARIRLGMTQNELAKKAGVSRQLIVNLEAGKANGIGLDKLIGILSVLELHLFVESDGVEFENGMDGDGEIVTQDASYAKAFDAYKKRYAGSFPFFSDDNFELDSKPITGGHR